MKWWRDRWHGGMCNKGDIYVGLGVLWVFLGIGLCVDQEGGHFGHVRRSVGNGAVQRVREAGYGGYVHCTLCRGRRET